jgi:hypothetical protein
MRCPGEGVEADRKSLTLSEVSSIKPTILILYGDRVVWGFIGDTMRIVFTGVKKNVTDNYPYSGIVGTALSCATYVIEFAVGIEVSLGILSYVCSARYLTSARVLAWIRQTC